MQYSGITDQLDDQLLELNENQEAIVSETVNDLGEWIVISESQTARAGEAYFIAKKSGSYSYAL